MRWNNLFDDLESQLEHELGAEDSDLQAEEERLRIGRMSIRDRLWALHEHSAGARYLVRLDVGGSLIRIAPSGLGKDWLSGSVVGEAEHRIQVIVPLRSIRGIILDRDQTSNSVAVPSRAGHTGLSVRLGMAFVLRDLCRRRCELDLVLVGATVHGTIDRVGRDHVDIAVHEAGTPRRSSAVAQYRIVPIDQVLLVRW
ncbi:hypothetical protein BKA04_000840 [Cryobacterium mesophilum]|uniref:Uncharacterized protein n=1 Tax=Terrimesophilobacter mesophilus TaxID=433647 RepID=A0A4R8V8F9_9MICO|nr:hypothetical protein [Terrimesophilobacter mesophilus]MBB5632617.1 hypothetical protein [Terrimesophilobacter mesophilus]TFB79431.1 hypothetical protein E3N84_04810 [Terrimesophilobacter mesophilus]